MPRKLKSIVFLAAVLASAASASDLTWVKLTASANGEYASYLDTDSYQPMGKNSWAVWVKMQYDKPKSDSLLSPRYRTEMRRYIIRCDEKTQATTSRNLFNEDGSPVKQYTWPESKWEFAAVGPKGGTNATEFAAICSLALFPKPLVQFDDNGQWVQLDPGGSAFVDASSYQDIGDLFSVRSRIDNRESKWINNARYRYNYLYTVGNCKANTSGIYAYGFVSEKGEVVESGLVPVEQIKMEAPTAGSANELLLNATCKKAPQQSTIATNSVIATGSGFFVTNNGYIVTNNHVVAGCKALNIRTQDKTAAPARTLATDAKNDLALLKADIQSDKFLAFRTTQASVGESVFAFGFPLTGIVSSGGNAATGIISANTGPNDDTSLIQISAPIQPGNSGGPLLDRNGAVVGVVVAKLNASVVASAAGALPENINFAIKHSTARAFLDAQDVKYTTLKAQRQLEPTVIFDQARAASVFIECRN